MPTPTDTPIADELAAAIRDLLSAMEKHDERRDPKRLLIAQARVQAREALAAWEAAR